ncbi:uncharacterized protein LOC129316099 isoform X1 [Prosopis cineraria]|uniref:uncharacterized protein LOC129316099 isoform X1 n=1 Tax=Prosopis cineraria TaxID=364024 RepID=UPI0024101EC7|nr:uncharacterized protein LOC129316099 isoform X1 [Prosopis cineraria]
MEMLGVNKNPAMMRLMRNQKRNDDVLMKKKKKKDQKKNIKVTYISSPMKVKTSASNFRALVQELTGQDSNVAEKFDLQESADHDHDDDHAAMAGPSSNGGGDVQREADEDGLYVPMREGSSWLDLLSDRDYCGGFQYSRSLLESFNQHHMKFDLVEI